MAPELCQTHLLRRHPEALDPEYKRMQAEDICAPSGVKLYLFRRHPEALAAEYKRMQPEDTVAALFIQETS